MCHPAWSLCYSEYIIICLYIQSSFMTPSCLSQRLFESPTYAIFGDENSVVLMLYIYSVHPCNYS